MSELELYHGLLDVKEKLDALIERYEIERDKETDEMYQKYFDEMLEQPTEQAARLARMAKEIAHV